MTKKIILIVSPQGYQHIEYGHTRKMLEQANVQVIVASTQKGTAHATGGDSLTYICNDPLCTSIPDKHEDFATAHIDLTINEIDPHNVDGVFIIGGFGALENLDNDLVHAVMQKIAALKKPFGAICISPRILAHAGLLNGKKATCWNGDHKAESFFKKYNVRFEDKPVVIDGNIITANGPFAALLFGKTIIEQLS